MACSSIENSYGGNRPEDLTRFSQQRFFFNINALEIKSIFSDLDYNLKIGTSGTCPSATLIYGYFKGIHEAAKV